MLDRFDRIFGEVFKGVLQEMDDPAKAIPEDWLKLVAELYLTPEQMEAIKSLGSWDEIMDASIKRTSKPASCSSSWTERPISGSSSITRTIGRLSTG